MGAEPVLALKSTAFGIRLEIELNVSPLHFYANKSRSYLTTSSNANTEFLLVSLWTLATAQLELKKNSLTQTLAAITLAAVPLRHQHHCDIPQATFRLATRVQT